MTQFLTQDKDFFPILLADKFNAIKAMGFEGIEIDGKHLLSDFHNVQNACEQTGLPVVTVCGGYRGWLGDFDEEKRAACLHDISIILDRISLLGGKGIVIPAAWGMFSLRLPPMVPPRKPDEDERVLLDSLSRLNHTAQKKGVQIFLEPLNRYEDHMINTLERARYFIDKGSYSHVSIIADFYHMNIEEARIDESILQHQAYIKHIHLADSHRFQPGTGHIDFENGLSALKKIGYSGAMTFECRVTGKNPEQQYADSLQFIKQLYHKLP